MKQLARLAAFAAVAAFAVLFVSCGVEEHYYLPQLPDGNIRREFNTEAVITIPPISDQFYYAGYYAIFYRIYISDIPISSQITQSDMSLISPSLAVDYNAFHSLTDPTNTSSITSSQTFRNRNYFELELEGVDIKSKLSTSGGTLRIFFSTAGDPPVAVFNDEPQVNLIRPYYSNQLISPEPRGIPYFINTPQLRNIEYANSNSNADVAGRTGTPGEAYVSMYIVAVGTNPGNFTPIYSKPTHISVFRLF